MFLKKNTTFTSTKHEYNFDFELPDELIENIKHDNLNLELLKNKTIIGLIGYARSGKDTIAKSFINKYGFHRVAFADIIKIEMNKHFKELVYNYLSNIPLRPITAISVHEDVSGALLLEDMRTLTLEMIDFQTEDQQIKKRLRPFIVWYAEKLRELNGPYYWINKSLEISASGYDKIILSDIRRIVELDIFKNSKANIPITKATILPIVPGAFGLSPL